MCLYPRGAVCAPLYRHTHLTKRLSTPLFMEAAMSHMEARLLGRPPEQREELSKASKEYLAVTAPCL